MTVFDPQEVDRLRAAFERSWRALAFAFHDPCAPGSRLVRRRLARSILALARQGVRDPERLSNAALAALPPFRSRR
jgi:hypothetical protein